MSSQSSVGHESDLKGDKCCFLVKELNQDVEGQLRSSLACLLRALCHPTRSLFVLTASIYTLQVAGGKVQLIIQLSFTYWLKVFEGLCCRSSLEVIETSFYLFLLAEQ